MNKRINLIDKKKSNLNKFIEWIDKKKSNLNKLIDWIEDKKKSTYFIIAFLILSYIIFFIGLYIFPDTRWIATVALFASIICPFAIFLVWVIDSSMVSRLLARRWTAILFSGVVIMYGMLANTFASELINDYFKVDPSHFTVTSIFVTTAYLFVGVFKPFVIIPIWYSLFFFGSLVVVWLWFYERKTLLIKKIFLFSFAMVIISMCGQSYNNLNKFLPVLAERIALWADFNEKHRCTAQWTVKVDKVIFLHDGNVLAHVAGARKTEESYEVLPCAAH